MPPPPAAPFPKVAVIGCGAIGGVVACRLLQKGARLAICTTNADIARVWTSTGPFLAGQSAAHVLEPPLVLTSPDQAPEKFDLALVAVPPTAIDDVATALSTSLTPEGRVVCLSNGFCEPHLAAKLGVDRVLGAVVTFGARMNQPGHYLRTSRGGFILGSLSGRTDPALAGVASLLSAVGPVTMTDNLRGARMSKLVINCAISGLGTVGGTVLGELLVKKDVRRVGIALMAEAILVARAERVTLQSIAGIDWNRWATDERRRATRLAQHALLLAVGLRYRRLKSSILSSIERGRAPSIDHINGEISNLGRRVGVPTPYNDAVVETVWRIAHGELEAGQAALDRVEQLANGTRIEA